MEALQAKHRKEQRDLQSRITQKKKQASKKTRRGVNDECDKLEAELKERQGIEIEALAGGQVPGEGQKLSEEELEKLTLQVDEDDNDDVDGTCHETGSSLNADREADRPSDDAVAPLQAKKRNRQKDRLAKRAAEQEELARQAEDEARNLPDKKTQERERMLASMQERSLQEKEIRADGHCLYSAVADQLEQLGIPIGASPDQQPRLGYQTVRATAADYIEAHQEDFLPFLEEPLPEYLHKVRNTGEWGGQLELTALAKTYGMDIHVLQDFGRVEKIEGGGGAETKEEKVMWLGYYKHGFGLGEHYNSLRKTKT